MLSGSTALPNARIDRTSPVPFYFQLARLLQDEITTGRWQTGERIASEPAICEHFDVSRSTVRQALLTLENEGLLSREKGRGTFVAEAKPGAWLLQSPEGFFHEEADRRGRTVTSTLLRAEREPLPGWATQALALPDHSDGVTIERLRSVDGGVALYVVNHLPAYLADALLTLDETSSLYELLERREGLTVAGGRRHVEAVTAGKQLGKLLDVDRTAALAFIESVSLDRN
ncbi:MAG: GntR family transcriptional regulator, partial [Solirubrobacteraceae bacterium]